MLLEEFEDNFMNKFDFFYLPVDKDVLFFIFRMTVMWDMPLLILSTALISKSFIKISIFRSGKGINHLKFVISAMPDVKELSN